MPNGNLGGGTGTQTNPFQVWDVADLNALRGKPTSATNRTYIRLKADIDFRGSANERHFPTLRFGNDTAVANSWDFIDIDGEGHTIRNFRQIGNDANACGFFSTLDGSIRNLSFVNVDLVITDRAIHAGVLGRNIRGGPVENIVVSGSVFSVNSVAGLINTLTTINNTTPFIVSGCQVGLVARCEGSFSGFNFSTNLSSIVEYRNCISTSTVYSASASANLGGFVGNTSGQNRFFNCISACRFIMITAAGQFTGTVAGYRATTNSITYSFRNCISMCLFDGLPPSTVNNMAAFAPNSLTTANTVECYSICRYNLRTSTANIRGGDGVIIFDWQNSGLPLSRFNDGATVGVTTAQLQSRAFLQARGWVFAS